MLKELASVARVTIAISIVTSLAAHAGWLDSLETVGLDVWIHLRPPEAAKFVTIVEITDDDYEDYFGGRSPLDRTRLKELLIAIAEGGPATIGVDIDTLPLQIESSELRSPFAAPVVWSVLPRIEQDKFFMTARMEEATRMAPVGLALFPIDPDGLVRRYRRSYEIDGRRFDALPWSVVSHYCDAQSDPQAGPCNKVAPAHSHHDEELVLNFAGEPYRFKRMSVKHLLGAARGEGWRSNGPLKGEIVILGGSFTAGRDQHATSVGAMSGVELVALAVETELRGGGIRRTNEVLMFVAELFCGLAIGFLHRLHIINRKHKLILSLALLPLLAVGSSLVSFYSLSRWANFVPVIIGSLIDELYEGAKIQHPEKAIEDRSPAVEQSKEPVARSG